MKISPITISANYKMNSFKAKQNRPQEQIQYSTWGDNYAFPIQQKEDILLSLEKERKEDILLSPEKEEDKNIINKEKEIIEKMPSKTSLKEESPEEYYRRKLYSTEWTM